MIKKFKEFIKESRILYIEDDEFNESIHMLGDNFCVDVKTSLKLSKLDASYRYGKRIYSYKENIEEFEDHFLRLKEVFNCQIQTSTPSRRFNDDTPEIIEVCIYPCKNTTGSKLKDFYNNKIYLNNINKELQDIENRIKSIYSPKFIFIDKHSSYNSMGSIYTKSKICYTMQISAF